MKFGSILPAFVIVIAACNASDAVSPPDTDGNLSATVGVAVFAATTVYAGFDDGELILSAVEEGELRKSITIAVRNLDGIGTFDLAASGNASSYVESGAAETQSWVCATNQGTGSVSITELSSTRVAGTFSFSAPALISSGAMGTKIITSGTFDVKPWRRP